MMLEARFFIFINAAATGISHCKATFESILEKQLKLHAKVFPSRVSYLAFVDFSPPKAWRQGDKIMLMEFYILQALKSAYSFIHQYLYL